MAGKKDVRTDPGAKGALSDNRRRRQAVLLVRLRAQRQPALLRRRAQGSRPRTACLYRGEVRYGLALRLQGDRRQALLRRHAQISLIAGSGRWVQDQAARGGG